MNEGSNSLAILTGIGMWSCTLIHISIRGYWMGVGMYTHSKGIWKMYFFLNQDIILNDLFEYNGFLTEC